MPKFKSKRKAKTVLRLPDLEQSRSAVLNSLSSPSSQRAYDRAIRDFIDWYCSEPRRAFNRTVVTRYRINPELERYAASTINLRFAAVRRLASKGSLLRVPDDSGVPARSRALRARRGGRTVLLPGNRSRSECFPRIQSGSARCAGAIRLLREIHAPDQLLKARLGA